MLDRITKNILQTIIYYDILDFPLTSFEVWKYLLAWNMEHGTWNNSDVKKYTLGEIIEVIEDKELIKHVEEFRGFFFLKGRKELVEKRIQNDKNSIAKFKIAERVTKYLKYVPFVRMVAMTGTLAMKNCEKNSDIDFFVVLEKGRIFTGRLAATAMVHLLGRRRHGKKIKNRICLNYFAATDNMEIQRQDLFAANEYSFIYPLFDTLVKTKKSIFCQFCKANIDWIKKYKPNFSFGDLKPAKYFAEVESLQQRIQSFFEDLINLFGGDRMEAWLKGKQIARIRRNPLTQKPGAYIEYTDENLIFLPEPQGRRVEEEWQKRLTTKNIFL